MSTPASIWTETVRVRSYETDPGGLASIQTICNYLQDAAGNHATALGVAIDDIAQDNLTWVVARLRVEMASYPAWRDAITIETWPSGIDRLYATREYVVRRASGELLARASSAWLVIDLERRRPVRMPEMVRSLRVPVRDRAVSPLAEKEFEDVLPHDVWTNEEEFPVSLDVRVRHSDLDINGHVNNVTYAEWSIESVPAEVVQNCSVRTLDLHFRAEAHFGDQVTVRTRPLEEDSVGCPGFAHVITDGDRELARARTAWMQR